MCFRCKLVLADLLESAPILHKLGQEALPLGLVGTKMATAYYMLPLLISTGRQVRKYLDRISSKRAQALAGSLTNGRMRTKNSDCAPHVPIVN